MNLTFNNKIKFNPIDTIKKISYVDNKPKVTVIVPIYKVDKYLINCIDSIVNQTLNSIEIILVDEGDIDRCREIIDYYQDIDSRIIAPHKKNGGYGASCNLGIKMARGEYISIVESDDMILPEMLQEMYSYAKALDADVVKTPFMFWDGADSYIDCDYRRQAAEQCPQGKLFSIKSTDFLLRIHASLWSGIYKTEYIHNKNICFIEAKGGAYVDVGFRIDTLVNTDKIAWIDKPYYIYRTNNADSTTNNFNLSSMLQRWKEVHDKFKNNNRENEYKKFYGKALIIDEYLNTLHQLRINPYKYTNHEISIIEKNLNVYNKDDIIGTSALSDKQKADILLFKDNPQKYFRLAKILYLFCNTKEYVNILLDKILKDNFIIYSSLASILLFLLFLSNYLLKNSINIYFLYLFFISSALSFFGYICWFLRRFVSFSNLIQNKIIKKILLFYKIGKK